jgi:hypothetical protein
VDPRTAARYAYGSADPINNVDPSGAFSMGSVGAAMNVSVTLAMRALPFFDIGSMLLYGPENDQSDKPYLLHSVLANMVPAVMDSLPSLAMGALAFVPGSSTHDHHTIPMYMCGHRQQLLATIPTSLHHRLHAELRMFEVGVVIAARAIEVSFKYRRRGAAPHPIRDVLGKKSIGRGAIGLGLELFYENRGYAAAAPNLMPIFYRERPRFVNNHHSCR